ncbi:MAG TPA: transposase, partial [Gemmataceae bacterium]|nr:transposase [Gemmataceae bacterium]
MVKPLAAGAGPLMLALDDTPTERYGRYVQGAGVHHNPTPGPAGAAFVYGHVWVVLGFLARHPVWGIVALPLLVRLYVRQKDLAGVAPELRPAFRTKLELGVELLITAQRRSSWSGVKWGMETSVSTPCGWREWRRLRALRLKQQGWSQR